MDRHALISHRRSAPPGGQPARRRPGSTARRLVVQAAKPVQHPNAPLCASKPTKSPGPMDSRYGGSGVAYRVSAAGYEVQVPSCCRRASTVAIRQRVVSSVRGERTQMPADRPVAMVPHGNAGLLIPAIGSGRVRHTLPARLSTLTHPIPASPRTDVPHQKDCRHASLPLSRDGR
jgi:hypothetical protein